MFTIASEETYQPEQVIFKEDSSGNWVYVVLSGSVEISKIVGGKKIVVGTVKEGEIFGELGFLGGIKRTATATAIGETTIGTFDREFLDAEFNKMSSELRTILVASVKRFANLLDRACDFSSRTEPRNLKTLSLTYKDRNAFIKAYTANISAGGLFIKTENPLKKDEMFLLKLQLPGLPEPLTIKSEVAWTKKGGDEADSGPGGMGVQFIEMSKTVRQTLEKYLKNT